MKKEVNSMRNAMKVAKWEIKRNMKNKSFIIGIFMTPAIFLIFMFIGGLMGSSGDDEVQETTHVYINDNIGFEELRNVTRLEEHLIVLLFSFHTRAN